MGHQLADGEQDENMPDFGFFTYRNASQNQCPETIEVTLTSDTLFP
jgi:hypothetical protein